MIKDYPNYYDDIIKSISQLVQIPTLYDAASITDKMPYGKKVYEGYEWLKKKALEDGFEVLEFDGHALAIRIKGFITENRIDVVSHMDVVEPGEGWSEDPFSGSITKEYIYGRGTQDMKGALILTYYALKFMKENQVSCKNELRVVFGCDEERTMEDMRYYIQKAGEPSFAFTPDGRFPFSLGEMGAIMWCVNGDAETCIEELDGGVQCNVVSPIAYAFIHEIKNYHVYKEKIESGDYQGEVILDQDKLKITIVGKASHASRPEDGLNATVKLLELIQSVSKDPLATLLHQCFCDSYGKGAGIDYDIENAGRLTLNLGILKITDGKLMAQIDCRYPYGIASSHLTDKIQKALYPLEVSLKYDDKPTMSDSDSQYVKLLLNTYREITKDTFNEPFISGGVTYSKAIRNCVAFGPGLKDEVSLAHQANEKLDIKKIAPLFEIYLQTMIRLANL